MNETQRTTLTPSLLGLALGGIYGALRGGMTELGLGIPSWLSILLFVVVGAVIGAIVVERVWEDRNWNRITLFAVGGAALNVVFGLAAGKWTLPAWGVDALEGALFGALVGASSELARRGVRVGAILGLAAGLAFSVLAIQNATELILRFGSLEFEASQMVYLLATTLTTVGLGAALGAIWTSLTARRVRDESEDR